MSSGLQEGRSCFVCSSDSQHLEICPNITFEWFGALELTPFPWDSPSGRDVKPAVDPAVAIIYYHIIRPFTS